MSLLDRVTDCNRCDWNAFRPLFALGRRIGYVRRQVGQALGEAGALSTRADGWSLRGTDSSALTAEVSVLHSLLRDGGTAGPVAGELCDVRDRWEEDAQFKVDRGVMSALGVRGYGVHLNCYVRRANELWVWIARRSGQRSQFPGLLDNTVGGCLPSGASVREWLLREAAEEAGIPAETAILAVATGLTAYATERGTGLSRSVQLTFDLEVDEGFRPKPMDGEVAGFELMPARALIERVAVAGEFKPNSGLVLIHFLLRHGLLDPSRRDYVGLVDGLRTGLDR